MNSPSIHKLRNNSKTGTGSQSLALDGTFPKLGELHGDGGSAMAKTFIYYMGGTLPRVLGRTKSSQPFTATGTDSGFCEGMLSTLHQLKTFGGSDSTGMKMIYRRH
jgi:hypothetical protein